jgi:hypothetical protein
MAAPLLLLYTLVMMLMAVVALGGRWWKQREYEGECDGVRKAPGLVYNSTGLDDDDETRRVESSATGARHARNATLS